MSGLPRGWHEDRLGNLTASVQKMDPVETGREIIRYVDIGSVDGSRHVVTDVQEIPSVGAPGRARQLLEAGDTLFSTVRPYLEKIAFVTADLKGEFASTGFSVLRPCSKLLPRFLYYFSISRVMLDQILPKQKGVSYPAVLDREVRTCVVPVPPFDEQQRIVEILDDHLSRLDVGERNLTVAGVRLGSLIEAFIGTAAEVAQASLFPLAEALAKPLGNGRSVPTSEVGFPVLRLSAMRGGSIDLDERKIGRWTAETAKPFLVKKDDVFIARGNGSLKLVGRAARVVSEPDPVAFPDTMIRVRADARIVRADFLTAIWNSRSTRRQIEAIARTTAGIYKVNQGDLRSIALPIPSLDEQDSFMARLNSLSSAVRIMAADIEIGQRRAQTLRRALLAAAFSGKLTGSASDLDRIEEMADV